MNLEKIAKRQEEYFKKSVWFMLQKIQKELNESTTDTITLLLSDSENSPSKTTQRSVLTFLEKTNSLSILQKFYSRYQIAHIFYRFGNITGNAKNKPQLYKIEIDEKYFSKIYSFYKKLYKKYDYAQFNQISGTLTLSGKTIKFTTNSSSYFLLSALFNENDQLYTPGDSLDLIGINEMIEVVTNEPFTLTNRSFYSAPTNVNERVLKKTRYKDFLITKDKCIQINEKYILQ